MPGAKLECAKLECAKLECAKLVCAKLECVVCSERPSALNWSALNWSALNWSASGVLSGRVLRRATPDGLTQFEFHESGECIAFYHSLFGVHSANMDCPHHDDP